VKKHLVLMEVNANLYVKSIMTDQASFNNLAVYRTRFKRRVSVENKLLSKK